MIARLVLAAFVGAGPPPLEEEPARPVDRVVHVFDGDTVCVDVLDSATVRAGRAYRALRTEDVRVDGYDAPELSEPGGPEASAALARLLGSGRVWVRWTGRYTFARKVCRVWVQAPGGVVVDAAAAMRAMGHVKGARR